MTTSLPGTNMRSPAQNVGTQVPAGSLVGRNPGGGVNAGGGSAQSIPIRSIQPVNTYKAPLKAGTGVTINNNTINAISGGSAINQLTGDVTAGPGTGSQVATLATVNPNVGSFTHTALTVDGKGRITAAANGTLSGDASLSGNALTLATVNSNLGTFNNITINAKGLATAGSNVAYLTGNQTITLTGYTTGSGATSIATTTSKVKGDTSGGNAAAGDVGEYISVIVLQASEVNISTAAATVATIALTAGDWDVWGEVWLDTITGSATVSGNGLRAGINSLGATVPVVPGDGVARSTVGLTTVSSSATAMALVVGPVRVSVSGNTNYFLVANCTVSAGTAFGYGKVCARRTR